MRVVQFDVDIFVQRTELWMILKTINFDLIVHLQVYYLQILYVSRSQSYLPSELHTLNIKFYWDVVYYPQKDERLICKDTASVWK